MSSNRASVLKQRVKNEQFYLVAIFNLAMNNASNYAVALFKLVMDNPSNHPANQPLSRKHKWCHLQVGSDV